MLQEPIEFEPIPYSGLLEAFAIATGWLSLVSFLSYGGCFLSQTISPAPVNVDQPLPDPFYDQTMIVDSATLFLCSAAVIAFVEFLRWRQRRTSEPL